MDYTIIGGDQREYGPYTAEQLADFVRQGRANGQTMARAGAAGSWQPLAALPEFAALFGAPAPAAAPPAVAPPVGAAPQGWAPAAAPAPAGSVRASDPIGLLKTAWQVLKPNLGGAAVTVLIWGLIAVAAAIIPIFVITRLPIAIRPILQAVVSGVVTGVAGGALYIYFLKLVKTGRAELGDSFAVFSGPLPNLVLLGLVTSIVGSLGSIAGALLGAVIGFGIVFPLTILGLAVAVVASVLWLFSFPNVIDGRLGFWEALEASRAVTQKDFGAYFLVLIVFGVTCFVGALACGIGILVAAPLVVCANTLLYRDTIGFKSPA